MGLAPPATPFAVSVCASYGPIGGKELPSQGRPHTGWMWGLVQGALGIVLSAATAVPYWAWSAL